MLGSPAQEILQFFSSKNFEDSRKFTYTYSPEFVKKALNALSRPQDRYKIIHIVGTVAKGSTVKFLSEMLTQDGFCVGSFYSPHLLRLNERIQVNHEEITNEELSHLWEFLKVNLNIESLSFFDCITTIAFLYFKKKKVDWAVIETGLGGRQDSTNNVKACFSVITPIGLDHQDILGDTLEKITMEKAGIIHSQPIFSHPQQKTAADILIRESQKKGSHLKFYPVNKDYGSDEKREPENFLVKNMYVCQWIYQEYFKKTPPKINLYFQGRLEILSKKPLIMFDSAHNELAAKELSSWLFSQKGHFKWALYLNTLRNRSLEEILSALLFCANKATPKLCFLGFLSDKERFHQFKDLSHNIQTKLTFIHTKEEFHEHLQDTGYSHLICGSMYLYEECLALSSA